MWRAVCRFWWPGSVSRNFSTAIITKQFGDISHYDLMTIVTKEEATAEGPVHEYLYESDAFSESLTVAVEYTRRRVRTARWTPTSWSPRM